MRIVQVAPLEEPVPPAKYGGTELVVYNLIEEMVAMGHEVYLLGAGDSTTSATLIPIVPKSLRSLYSKEEIDTWRNFLKVFHIATVLRHIRDIGPDIVHNHYAWRLIQFSDFIPCPMYTTVHGPITSIHERYTYQQYKDANYISISNNQRKALPIINWIKTIYNGIDLTKFEVGTKKDNYFLFLGRTSPEKGLKEICHMIQKTNHKLVIAAKVDTVDEAYFETEIAPCIDDDQITFVGEVDHQQKAKLLKHAKGLLLWLNWEEPFGLVVVEAGACGTPVIVNKRGSMPEIVVHGKTGFLVGTIEQMQKKLDQIHTIDPMDCRTHVEQNFSANKMAREYLKLAGKLTA